MMDRPTPDGYWCEVRADGLVYGWGTQATFILGTHETISPVLALRWIIGNARHIADRLDPDPQRSRWVQPFMEQPNASSPDGPTQLRLWCMDRWEQQAARKRIKDGDPLFLVVEDADCRYTLSVWPIQVPAPGQVYQVFTPTSPAVAVGIPSARVVPR
ncbi:hypothetical protein ACWGKQ_14060 [Streptomyces sp. NPDC054770]